MSNPERAELAAVVALRKPGIQILDLELGAPIDHARWIQRFQAHRLAVGLCRRCLLYTSDAADERSSVDLGGRRIIKKKKQA